MPLYVKIDRATGAELVRQDFTAPKRDLGKPVVWLPLVRAPQPTFDAEAEKLVPNRTLPDLTGSQYVSPTAEVVDGWTVAPLTASERLARRDAKLAALNAEMVPVGEEILRLLLAKGAVAKTELSQASIDKINARRTIRGEAPL